MWDGELTGEVVGGRYELGALYGSGGMAEVYRALDVELGRRVAVKLFQGTAAPEDQIRLAREAQVLASLRFPGVVSVYDTGSFRGRPYYVMQAIEGGTLRKRMRQALAPEVVARVGAEVAGILAHVHAHDVVHRDVKPSNILLEQGERRAYLADFGLALQAQVTRVTRSGILVGTAGYLAPEQVRGNDVTPASDVYALGLVLLECLTGRPEYPGGDTEAALARLHREPRIPANLPRPWADVLAAMTTSLPSKRPSATECAELLRAAERASRDVPPLAQVVETARSEPGRRRRALLVAAAAAGVGAFAILGAVLFEGTPEAEVPQPGTSVAPVVPAVQTTGTTTTTTPSASTVTVVEQAPEAPQPQQQQPQPQQQQPQPQQQPQQPQQQPPPQQQVERGPERTMPTKARNERGD
jgi:eukaryotic-like serine/threonine-protein kinase